ncbi:MAG TPA: hypothetical protein VGM91_10080 [Conexibacter sp.]
MELGISDSDAPTVTEPYWDGLRIDRARIVVPYDVAVTSGAPGGRRRASFEAYLENASEKGVDVLVVFAPSVDVRGRGNVPVAPSVDEFTAALTAFLQQYPQARTIAPWNEPNNRDGRRYPLSGDPKRAADYWLAASQLLAGEGTVVAGSFAGIPGDDRYVNAYQKRLRKAGATPDVWAFHDHGDVNAFQENGSTAARIARFYLGKLAGRWGGSRVWIDEIGARYRDARGGIWGDDSQAQATQFLLGLGTLDPRVEALYYYNYSNQCAMPQRCAVQDRGLVSPNPFNGEPPDYDDANRRRAAYDVVANRGPAFELG